MTPKFAEESKWIFFPYQHFFFICIVFFIQPIIFRIVKLVGIGVFDKIMTAMQKWSIFIKYVIILQRKKSAWYTACNCSNMRFMYIFSSAADLGTTLNLNYRVKIF